MKQLSQANARRASQEWQQKKSSCRRPCDEPKMTAVKKQLRFSEHSELRIYHPDQPYEAKKSYTSFNQKVIKEATLLKACHINDLMASVPVSQKHAIPYLLRMKLLRREDLIGLEHMIGHKAVTKAEKERQVYALLVLGLQDLLPKKYDHIYAENHLA